MDGFHFAGATQLLSPNSCSKKEAEEAATALVEAIGGQLPETANHKLEMTRKTFAFKEFRTPTKNLLSAVANALQQALPAGWSLQKSKPSNPLDPAGIGRMRIQYDKSELELLSPQPAEDACLHWLWDAETCSAKPDHYTDENFVRLVFSADEGTEVEWIETYNFLVTGCLGKFYI